MAKLVLRIFGGLAMIAGALILALAPWPAASDLRKADCVVTADRATKDIDAASAVLNRMLAVSFVPLLKDAQPDLRPSVEAAARAQSAAIAGLQGYVDRLKDMRDRLRACAR